jgi:hypothetical protein
VGPRRLPAVAQLSEDRWTDLINLWLQEVRGWDEHWLENVRVEAGSELALDDRLLPGAPTSGSAILGIQSAVDHLGVLRDALRASSLRRPFGYYTLARAAMFASARTIWILSPDERECRQERGLWMEWQSDRHFTKTMVQFQNQPDPGPRAMANDIADRVANHQAMLRSAAASLGVDLVPRGAPTDTEIVEEAGRWLEGVDFDPRLGSGLAWQWRTHSGAAHSLPWVMVGKVNLETVYEDGTGVGALSPSLEDLGMAFGTAIRATSEAIRLFATRGSGSP